MHTVTKTLFSLIALSVFSAAVTAFAPDGTAKKGLHFLVALMTATLLLLPLSGLLTTLPALFSSGGYEAQAGPTSAGLPSSAELLADYAARSMRVTLEEMVRRKFGAECEIFLQMDAQDPEAIALTGVYVRVSDSGGADIREIVRYLREETLAEVTLIDENG